MQYLRKKPDGKYVIPEKPVEENEGEAEQEIPVQEEKVRLLPEKGTAGSLKIKIPKIKIPKRKILKRRKARIT